MPLWLTKIWNWLKLVGVWIKGNFTLILLLIGVVYAFFFVKKKTDLYNLLFKEFRDQQVQNKQQLDDMRKVQQEQIQKQQEIDKKYHEVLEKIEKDYQGKLAALTTDKEKELRRVIEKNQDDPVAMATEINSLFGIPLYSLPNS